MKKYIKPLMKNEVFRSNDFVAACYKIKCTTPNGNSSYNYLYDDTNNNGELDNGDTRLYYNRNSFRGCNNWHIGVIQDEEPTANGFVSKKAVGSKQNTISNVFWWNEELGSSSDYHVMTPGSQNYETNPNAS